MLHKTLDKQISDLRFQAPDHYKVIGHGNDLYDSTLVQNEYLKHFNMTCSRDKVSDVYKQDDDRDPSQDKNDDQKFDCDERLKNPGFTGYF